ncbi:YIP1 family protein [uncultured Roseovarius sp.]|uniref:YIP1 family protein n=1 Tax=uncultured Roseovarius sp. TaxID=293344 RepID=UPI00260AB259|nr:YIP1 family protein [uncultured Roseovarius sp.]
MPVTRDIVATYRGPRRVMRRLLDMGQREDRALVMLIAACVVVFVAQWPRLAREAHLTGEALNPLLGGALLAWVFIAPLLLYALALLSHAIAKVFKGAGTAYGARLALFWAFLAASPLILLHGLVAGFIGPGAGLQLVGFVWFAAFGWFWLAGLIEAEWSGR